ncbi:hypothetical protein MJH12_12055 [bacterium]|nr:hypothetical protein [bacterium]
MQITKFFLILLVLLQPISAMESLNRINYFEGLNAPTQSIQQLPNKRLYQSGVVSYPAGYNHYNRLYFNSYNYRMPVYPYIPYQGKGARDPRYFQNRKKKPAGKQKFSKARIQHIKIKSEQSSKGVIEGRKVNPAMWFQMAGFKTQMPSVAKNDVVAYYATKKDETPIKIIDVLEKDVDGETKIVVVYKKQDDQPFYRNTPPKAENKEGLLSIAIFPNTKQEIVFVDQSKLKSLEAEDENSEFLDSGYISEMAGRKTKSLQKSSSKSINITFSKELDIVNKIADIDINPDIFDDVDFDRQIVFLTGRLFTSSRAAKQDSSAKIVKIETNKASSSISLNIFIEEDADKIKTSISEMNEKMEDENDDEFYWFRGHYVVSERPKGSYRSRFILDRQ